MTGISANVASTDLIIEKAMMCLKRIVDMFRYPDMCLMVNG